MNKRSTLASAIIAGLLLAAGTVGEANAIPVAPSAIPSVATDVVAVRYTTERRAMRYHHMLRHSHRGARFEHRENHRLRCNRMPSRC